MMDLTPAWIECSICASRVPGPELEENNLPSRPVAHATLSGRWGLTWLPEDWTMITMQRVGPDPAMLAQVEAIEAQTEAIIAQGRAQGAPEEEITRAVAMIEAQIPDEIAAVESVLHAVCPRCLPRIADLGLEFEDDEDDEGTDGGAS